MTGARSRGHRDSESAGQPGPRPSARRQDVEQLAEPGCVRIAGAGDVGGLPPQRRARAGFWTVDASLSRVVSLGATGRVAFRIDAFNLFNTVNWNSPDVNFTSSTFGSITSIAGTPRILQFGIRSALAPPDSWHVKPKAGGPAHSAALSRPRDQR